MITLSENKDILKCERCFRSIGLWLYRSQPKVEKPLQDGKDKENEDDAALIFANTQPYLDEIVVKSVLVKIINQIVIEQESQALKQGSSPTTRLKRKRSCDDYDNTSKSNVKDFDPIGEHFSWCPWLNTVENKTVIMSNLLSNKSKRFSANACVASYEVVCKRLREADSCPKNVTTKPTRWLASSTSADQLIDRARSAQSLLINCASKYSLK